ncbi:hypothetical protein LguiA_029977 [Lonicera macranthoides]
MGNSLASDSASSSAAAADPSLLVGGSTMSNSSASAFASAADPSLLVGEYDVFLSFCGQDTRQHFTDHLYASLNNEGIRTFRDNEGLHVGEEIGPVLLKAITDSKISIPIFSKNYAFSKWCLLELAHMVQCLENGGQMIFPIFYDVDPKDIWHQTGNYEEAFRQHKKRLYNEKAIQGWKDALKKVGQLKGLELKKEMSGYEGQLVAIIMKRVLEILMQNDKHEDSYLVGMPSRIEKIEKLLNIHSDGVRFIGVHGMGGLGKTTIAKVIYNKYQHHFDCHSFLPDVQQTETHNGIVHLQKQLLSTILNTKNVYVNDYKDGIRQIKGIDGRKKVIIVLDDVNNESQIEKLVRSWTWFGARSRIIIITRNYEILHAFKSTTKGGHPEVYGSYQLDYLNPVESFELFCKHTFGSETPPEDYDSLSKGIASTAAGLPLVLKVTGSLITVGDDDILRMHDQLGDLGKQIVHEEKLDEFGRRSRLWNTDEVFEVYETGQCLGEKETDKIGPIMVQVRSHLGRG